MSEDTVTLVLPSVSIGGSGKVHLMESRYQAGQAIRNAISALREMAPHPRDFVSRDADYKRARDHHTNRIIALQKIYYELVAENDAISEWMGESSIEFEIPNQIQT